MSNPGVLIRGSEWEKEETLKLYKNCSAIAKTLMFYQHCFSHISKTQHSRGYEEILTPSQPVPVQHPYKLSSVYSLSTCKQDVPILFQTSILDCAEKCDPRKMRQLVDMYLSKAMWTSQPRACNAPFQKKWLMPSAQHCASGTVPAGWGNWLFYSNTGKRHLEFHVQL